MNYDEAELLVKLLSLCFTNISIFYGTNPNSVVIDIYEEPYGIFISFWTNRVIVRRLLFRFKEVRPIRKRREDMEFIEIEGELLKDECWTKIEFELTTANETFRKIMNTLAII